MKKINFYIFFIFLFVSFSSSASVTMLKTRVIYHQDSRFEEVKFKNNDSIPYIMQLWIDINDENSTPDNADNSFIIQPAIFRINENTGRDVRIIYSGKDLPKDRESLFYFNVLQIPPKNNDVTELEKNSIQILVRHRIKLFYRPSVIENKIDKINENLSFYNDGKGGINIKNDSPFYVTITSLKEHDSTGKIAEFKSIMLAPFSTEKSRILNKNNINKKPISLDYKYINDLGGLNEYTVKY